jgi:hypothetical protein
MPDWTPEWEDVEFDHAAAAEAAGACRRSATRVRSQWNDIVAPAVAPAQQDWTGRLAQEFTTDVWTIGGELLTVATQLDNLATQIETASAEARAEQLLRIEARSLWRAQRAQEDAAHCGGARQMPC